MATRTNARGGPLEALASRWRDRAVRLRLEAKRFERCGPDDLEAKNTAATLVGCAVELEDVLEQHTRGEA